MKIAIVAAGSTPAEADWLLRSMATLKFEGMVNQNEKKLIDGMLASLQSGHLNNWMDLEVMDVLNPMRLVLHFWYTCPVGSNIITPMFSRQR
jgi:hypothetical protein